MKMENKLFILFIPGFADLHTLEKNLTFEFMSRSSTDVSLDIHAQQRSLLDPWTWPSLCFLRLTALKKRLHRKMEGNVNETDQQTLTREEIFHRKYISLRRRCEQVQQVH